MRARILEHRTFNIFSSFMRALILEDRTFNVVRSFIGVHCNNFSRLLKNFFGGSLFLLFNRTRRAWKLFRNLFRKHQYWSRRITCQLLFVRPKRHWIRHVHRRWFLSCLNPDLFLDYLFIVSPTLSWQRLLQKDFLFFQVPQTFLDQCIKRRISSRHFSLLCFQRISKPILFPLQSFNALTDSLS
jgi:hypothetical protein